MNAHGSWPNHGLALGLEKDAPLRDQFFEFARRYQEYLGEMEHVATEARGIDLPVANRRWRRTRITLMAYPEMLLKRIAGLDSPSFVSAQAAAARSGSSLTGSAMRKSCRSCSSTERNSRRSW
jgi:hypothetical protein